MLDAKLMREYRKQAQSLDATLQIGKAGVTGAVVSELEMQLKEHKMVKVKVLKGDVDDAAAELVKVTGAELIDVRGKTAVLRKD